MSSAIGSRLRRSAGSAAIAAAFAAATLPRSARADDAARGALAEALFRDGQALLEQGEVHQACEKLAESLRLDPALGTLLNLGVCHEREGRTASAWSELSQAAALAAQTRQADRESFARARVAAIEVRLSRLRLDPPPTAPLPSASIDGHAVGPATWGVAIPLDPGPHVVTFTAPGNRPRSITVDLPPGPALVPVAALPLEVETDARGSHGPTPSGEARLPVRPIAVGALAAGLVALAVGAFLGARAIDRKGEVDAHCSGSLCDATGMTAQRDARSVATAATITMSAGLVLAVAGGAVFLLAPSGNPATARARVAW